MRSARSQPISISVTLPNKFPRGPGFWKFNNTLLKDPQYIYKIRNTYTQTRKYYGHLTDKRLFWEMIKMELDRLQSRLPKTSPKALEIGNKNSYENSTISMAQYAIISPPPILMECYGNMINLKPNLNQFMEKKESKLYFEQNVAGWKTENARQNISSI